MAASGFFLYTILAWASMSERARVEFHHDREISELPSRFRPEVPEARCGTSKNAPFGRVESRYALIKAPLFKATVVYNSRSSHQHIKYGIIGMGDEGNQVAWASVDFDVDCLLPVKDGNALRAMDEDDLERWVDSLKGTAMQFRLV